MEDENIYYRVAKRVVDENNQIKYMLIVFLSLVLIDYLMMLTLSLPITFSDRHIFWFFQGIKVLYLIRAIRLFFVGVVLEREWRSWGDMAIRIGRGTRNRRRCLFALVRQTPGNPAPTSGGRGASGERLRPTPTGEPTLDGERGTLAIRAQ